MILDRCLEWVACLDIGAVVMWLHVLYDARTATRAVQASASLVQRIENGRIPPRMASHHSAVAY